MTIHHIFESVVGILIFDDRFNLVEKYLFEGNKNKSQLISKIKKKYAGIKELPKEGYSKALFALKDPSFFPIFYKRNTEMTKKDVRKAVTDDVLIIQALRMLDDLHRILNTLSKQFREWYSYYNPEFSFAMPDHESFIRSVMEGKDKKLDDTMGGEIGKGDADFLRDASSYINSLYAFKKQLEDYLERLMKKFCPNITAVAGVLIGAKLIEKAGSLKRLSEMSSQTIQVLGAEKALFRHLKNKKNLPPKHGIIHEHRLIGGAPKDELGKRARMLADKIGIAAKVDFFKGKFVGDKFMKEIEERFG